MALNANALITVLELRDELPMGAERALDDWQARFEIAINRASNKIERAMGRTFRKITHVDEPFSGDGGVLLRLNHCPIISVAAVKSADGSPYDASSYAISESRTALRSVGGSDLLGSVSGAGWPVGSANLLVSWDGGYATIPDDVKLGCCLLAHSYIIGRGKDPRISSERGKDYSASLDAIDPITGLPYPVLDLCKSYKFTDVVGVAAA